jgi:IS30 family transposase
MVSCYILTIQLAKGKSQMKYKQLTENERYQIYSLKKAGHAQQQIAKLIGRSASTISRELRRNSGKRNYRPKQAHQLALDRRRSVQKTRKITAEVLQWIIRLIRQDLSPEQVSLYLRRHKNLSLHHETIYQLIYADKAQGGDLHKHLRIASKAYRKRYGHYDRRGKIKDRVSIEKRPEVVDKRSRIGDWEGDTIIGKGRSGALVTLVERKTLYTVILRVPGKYATPLAKTVVAAMKPLAARIKTITLDNGLEFAGHAILAKKLNAAIYFAHPYASWERGTNENTNGLIRQYFPKGTDFNQVTNDQIKQAMDRLNNRPRKTRGNKSPNELFWGQQVDLLAA